MRQESVQEPPHETDCVNVVNGKECADRGLSLSEMCAGCRTYWTGAAELVGKAPEQYLAESVADWKRSRP